MKRLCISFICIFALLFSIGGVKQEVNAATLNLEDNSGYYIVNGNTRIPMYQDYDNPDTGEYFHWMISKTRSGQVIKTFSYKIRWSVTSSKFTVDSSKVKITSNAHIEDEYGTVFSGNDGHKYEVSIVGILTRNLKFSIGENESGTVSGLQKGGNYTIRITNESAVSASNYLTGSGQVISQ